MNKKQKVLFKKFEDRVLERDKMIGILKAKIKDPYLDADHKIEILGWFKRFYNDEVFGSDKTIKQWFSDLRRLAYEER